MKKLNKTFAYVMIALTGLSFTACSDDDLDTNPYSKSGVNLLAFGPAPALRNTEIRITGTNMTAVDKVVFAADATVSEAAVERSAFNKVDAENIYLNIPDATVPGAIKLVAGRDTIVSEGTLTFEEPIEVTEITPVSGLNADDVITIKGDYVYNIAEVTFTSGVVVPAEEFVSSSRREIKVKVPLAAESGTVTLSDGADWTLEWEKPLEILTATVTSVAPDSTDFGQEIEIKGTNLHTVQNVMFAGGVEAAFTMVDNKTIKATVPSACKSGAVTLLLFSGAAITTPEVKVTTVSITGIDKNEDIIEGDVITITGKNFDRVTGVNLPGVDGFKDYTISGNTLTFTVPKDFVDGQIVLVQNANISAAVDVTIRKMSGIIWMGNVECTSSWSGALQVFNWESHYAKFMEALTEPGTITFGIETTGSDPMIKIAGSDWNSMVFENVPSDCVLHPAVGDKEVSFNVTAADITRINPAGFVIYGCNYKLKYVKFIADSAPVVLWEGSEDLGSWGPQPYIGSESCLIDAEGAEGQVIRIYGTPKASDWIVQIFNGHWDGQIGGDYKAENGYSLEEGIAIELTSANIKALKNPSGWGGLFVMQGQNCIITKVTLSNK